MGGTKDAAGAELLFGCLGLILVGLVRLSSGQHKNAY